MKKNKEKWIETVFDELGTLAFGYIKAMVKDAHFAEDILQNVFLKLWKVDEQSIQNPKAYILTMARNESLTHIYKREKTKLHALGDSFEIFESKDTVNCLETMCIEEALLKLPTEQREVVFLKIYAQLTFQSIADTLSVSINTASSRYRYGMEKLCELLGDDRG